MDCELCGVREYSIMVCGKYVKYDWVSRYDFTQSLVRTEEEANNIMHRSITPRVFIHFMRHINEVKLVNWGKTHAQLIPLNDGMVNIFINESESSSIGPLALTHECVHGIYRIHAEWKMNLDNSFDQSADNAIHSKAIDFYNKHKDLVDFAYTHFVSNSDRTWIEDLLPK
jgi:hypothetical protein